MIFFISSIVLFFLVNGLAARHVLNNIDKVLAGDQERLSRLFKFLVYVAVFNLTTFGSWVIVMVRS